VTHGRQVAKIGETGIWVLPSPSPAAQNAWNEEVWHDLAREVKVLKAA
jgi:TDG/mug DNA glycosylase family protein